MNLVQKVPDPLERTSRPLLNHGPDVEAGHKIHNFQKRSIKSSICIDMHFLEQFAVQVGLEGNLNEFASIFIQVTTYPREEWRRHYASLVQVPLHGCRPWLSHRFIHGSSQVLKQSRVISAVEHYLGGPVEPAEADQVVGICNSLW